jgi:hypothetical protein
MGLGECPQENAKSVQTSVFFFLRKRFLLNGHTLLMGDTLVSCSMYSYLDTYYWGANTLSPPWRMGHKDKVVETRNTRV